MLFQPTVMALLLLDGISLALLLPVAWFALHLLRWWDIGSGSALQIRLERRTSLISTVLGFVFVSQLLALLLLVFTADALAVQFVGAMCAVGSFNVNGWGFPALYLKLTLFFPAAAWLLMNHLDNRAPDYPLVRVKYALLLLFLPVMMLAAWFQFRYFADMRADVITSCCGSLFSPEGRGVAADLAGLPALPAMFGFYLTLGLTVAAGLFYLWQRRGALLFGALGALSFPVAMAAIVSFVSLYVYEHPLHHCPFCLLKAEYDFVGYLLYLPLFIASAIGFGLLVNLPFARAASLRPAITTLVPRLVALATLLFATLMALVAWFSLTSNLILLT